MPVSLCVLAGCTVTVREVDLWDHKSALGLRGRDAAEVLEVECRDGVETVELVFRARCLGGIVTLEMRDPRGDVCFREVLQGGRRDGELRVRAREGSWRCSLVLERFDGDYEVLLRARSEPGLDVHLGLLDAYGTR